MVLVRPDLPLTPLGERELAAEVACLECLRRDLVTDWESAPEVNPRALRNELAAITCEIDRLRLLLAGASRVGDSCETVAVGSEVTVVDAGGSRSYTITGPLAANHRSGRISFDSRLASALLGRRVGEVAEVDSGGEVEQLTVVAIGPARFGEAEGGEVTEVEDTDRRTAIGETDVLRDVIRRHPAALRVLLRRGIPATLAEDSVAEAARACGIRASLLRAELQAAADQSSAVRAS